MDLSQNQTPGETNGLIGPEDSETTQGGPVKPTQVSGELMVLSERVDVLLVRLGLLEKRLQGVLRNELNGEKGTTAERAKKVMLAEAISTISTRINLGVSRVENIIRRLEI